MDNVDLGKITMEDIVSKANIAEVLNNRATKVICTNLDNRDHIIGASILTMDWDDIDKIKTDKDDINDNSILVISKYQIISFLESVNGFISILKENKLLNNYNYNLIIKDAISLTKNLEICMKSELDRLINTLGTLLEHELEYVCNGDVKMLEGAKDIVKKFDFMIKNYWFISENEFNRLNEDAINRFNKEENKDNE